MRALERRAVTLEKARTELYHGPKPTVLQNPLEGAPRRVFAVTERARESLGQEINRPTMAPA